MILNLKTVQETSCDRKKHSQARPIFQEDWQRKVR